MSRDWKSLIHRHLDSLASDEEVAALSEQLESSAELRLTYLQMSRVHAALATGMLDGLPASDSEQRLLELTARLSFAGKKKRRTQQVMIAVATAAIVVALIAGALFFQPRESEIATITAIEGAVRWTGDGGLVTDEISAGRQVTGGTLEALELGSSVELKFSDGTTVAISGRSTVTISDDGQKVLVLREGQMSVDAHEQEKGRPLRVVTPSAELEVLGTQFDVSADLTRTEIVVNEGLVRATRLTDSRPLNVAAGQRAIASIAARGEWIAHNANAQRHEWRADLEVDTSHGKWLSAAFEIRTRLRAEIGRGQISQEEARQEFFRQMGDLGDDAGFVQAMPMRNNGKAMDVVVVDVGWGDLGGVTLIKGNQLRFQGRVGRATDLTFGFSAIGGNGASGPRYLKSFAVMSVADTFEVVIPLEDFVAKSKNGSPFGRELVSAFCFSPSAEAELEITNVELIVE